MALLGTNPLQVLYRACPADLQNTPVGLHCGKPKFRPRLIEADPVPLRPHEHHRDSPRRRGARAESQSAVQSLTVAMASTIQRRPRGSTTVSQCPVVKIVEILLHFGSQKSMNDGVLCGDSPSCGFSWPRPPQNLLTASQVRDKIHLYLFGVVHNYERTVPDHVRDVSFPAQHHSEVTIVLRSAVSAHGWASGTRIGSRVG